MSGTSVTVSTPQPMLSQTLGAYLYEQYADDPDLPAIIAALNQLQQYYLDWFTSVGLAYYPGLSGDLLDWLAHGVYGVQRQNIVLDTIASSGMLNTLALDTEPLNEFTEPVSITLPVSDDVFKRIITWNFYKGDGFRFTMKWLKRRIMRFLVGVNGLDPNPSAPGFKIGTEDTSAVGVTVSNDTVTVTINGVLLSQKTQLQPLIPYLFKAAFLGGMLQMPEQYHLAVDIIAAVTASISPASVSATGIATTLVTPLATMVALGGDGQYSYSWAWLSGGTGITIDNALAAETNFTATGMARGAVLSGVAACTVTDSSSEQAVATVNVTITNVPPVTVTLSTTSISLTGASGSEITGAVVATVAGGAAPYTYQWSWSVGGADIAITDPTGSSTTFDGVLQPGTTVTGTAQLLVTDSYGQTATADCSVSITRVSLLTSTVSPSSLSDITAVSPSTTASTTVTASGGQTPYTYAWSFQSGGADLSIGSPTAATTTFTGSGMSPGNTYSGTAQCVTTDFYGQTSTVTVSVSIQYTQLTLTVSPASLSVTSDTASETTGTATVTASDGASPYTYAWSFQSGGSGITINSPSADATTFTASALSPGETVSGTAQCVVTDAVGHQATITLPVSLARVTAPSVSVSPASVSVTGASASETTPTTTATVSGGLGPYTYGWTWQSGGTGITIDSPSAASTNFSASGLTSGETLTGTALVTVTDSYGQTATNTVSVSIERVTAVSVAATPTSVSYTGASPTEATSTVTASASGGSGNYTYAWTWQSGGSSITIGSPNSASTEFTGNGLTAGQTLTGTALVTATDGYGQTGTTTVSVSIARVTTVSASVSPTSLSASSQTEPVTTGSATVSASGGSGAYTYAWSWQSGGTDITITSPTSASTTFSGNGLTEGQQYTGTAQCVVTDGYGQTAAVTVGVSVTYSVPQPLQHIYTSGSGTETVPSGYNTVVMEIISGGGGGEGGSYNPSTRQSYGGTGGDSGTYVRSQYSCSPGQTVSFVVGAGGAGGSGGNFGVPGSGGTSSIESGSLTITTMTAPGGNTYNAPSGGNQANTTFNAGAAGTSTSGGAGGAAQTGVDVGAYGAGGRGGYGTTDGSAGGNGVVSFYYTFV